MFKLGFDRDPDWAQSIERPGGEWARSLEGCQWVTSSPFTAHFGPGRSACNDEPLAS